MDFRSDNQQLNEAYRIAIGDIVGNILPYENEGKIRRCFIAGLDYDMPWTRDAAINSMFACNLLFPDIAKNTLFAVCENKKGEHFIGGQYWDKVIWILGAKYYVDVNADKEFEDFALKTSVRTLHEMEENEFDCEIGLFRGPAVYGDGIAAYPNQYAKVKNESGILFWVRDNPDKKAEKGFGIPMFALSTNCLYYQVYKTLANWTKDNIYQQKADALKNAINSSFWNKERGSYDYLKDESQAQEGLGLAFAILFGVADSDQTKAILRNVYCSKHGIPCVHPNFERYQKLGEYGRHSGTVWPMVQGWYALANYIVGEREKTEKDLYLMAEKAVRDLHFSEIYHPLTGLPYGGIQETCTANGSKMLMWRSYRKQTWSATAFLALVLYTVIGIKIESNCLTIKPHFPQGVGRVSISDLKIRGLILDIEIENDNREYSIDLTKKGYRHIKLK